MSDVLVAGKSNKFPGIYFDNRRRLFHNPSERDLFMFVPPRFFLFFFLFFPPLSRRSLDVGNVLQTLDEDDPLGPGPPSCAYNNTSRYLYHIPRLLTYHACIDRWVRCNVRDSSTQTGEGPLGPGAWVLGPCSPVGDLTPWDRPSPPPPVTTSSSSARQTSVENPSHTVLCTGSPAPP